MSKKYDYGTNESTTDEEDDEKSALRTLTLRRNKECRREGCDEKFFSKIGREYHLLRDHEDVVSNE